MRGLEQIPWLYDPVCALYELLGLDRWRRWLVAGARGLALDVGCGTGRNLPLYREGVRVVGLDPADRKSTRLNSSHVSNSYAVFCLKKKKSVKQFLSFANRCAAIYS